MFLTFGNNFAPGDLLNAKTFEKVASLELETESTKKIKVKTCDGVVRPTTMLSDLCKILLCDGQYFVKSIFTLPERFDPFLNFCYAKENPFLFVGLYVTKQETESCFEITKAENTDADCMVSKTLSGSFFICILSSKVPIKHPTVILKEFSNLFFKTPSKGDFEMFNGEGIEVTVFANWTEMLGSQMSVHDAVEKSMSYSKNTESQVICFEIDDFQQSVPGRQLILDHDFDKCYRLMRSVRNKCGEFQKIYDSKKKKNETMTFRNLTNSLRSLEVEIKELHFIKFEFIEKLNSLLPDALSFMESFLKNWLKNGSELNYSMFQIVENCLTWILTKFNGGNCVIRDCTVYYNAEDMDILYKIFGNERVLIVKPNSANDFKKWLDVKFLDTYPLCFVQKFPNEPDPVFLCDKDSLCGFGVITPKRCHRKVVRFENDAFLCVNNDHQHQRYWKCTGCKNVVTSDGKQISCECGVISLDNVEFKCAASTKICNRKPYPPPRNTSKPTKNSASKDDYKKITIVLFGPIGGGKSTLINAAMNYIEYPSYHYASTHALLAPIPYQFVFADGNYDQRLIESKEIPVNSPEDFSSSCRTTQKPNIYEKYYDGKTYLFVDSCGFGLPRKHSAYKNIEFWNTLKQIDAVWITISATEKMGDLDESLLLIIKYIPKQLFSRIAFVFTNIHGEHSLRFNSNVAEVAQYVSKLRIGFGENNVFAIENSCLKNLYVQHAGFSVSSIQTSASDIWSKSRGVILRLLEKASEPGCEDDEVFFLNNLLFLYLQLKSGTKLLSVEDFNDCANILSRNFVAREFKIAKEKSPSRSDVMKSLSKMQSKIGADSKEYKLICDFIEIFGEKKHGVAGALVQSLFSFWS